MNQYYDLSEFKNNIYSPIQVEFKYMDFAVQLRILHNMWVYSQNPFNLTVSDWHI